jgi:hypothetical protein
VELCVLSLLPEQTGKENRVGDYNSRENRFRKRFLDTEQLLGYREHGRKDRGIASTHQITAISDKANRVPLVIRSKGVCW